MRETIRIVGEAIRNGSKYLPIRNHAAALAAEAPPKDYLKQVQNIYDDAIKRWRYVKDPVHRELVSYSPQALWRFVLAGDGIGVGRGRGAGDCECVASALGAELYAIGMPVRLAVTAPPESPPGRMYAHIFVQARVPGHGWVSVDPVVHPKHQFGHTPAHSRIAYFDLFGRQLGSSGNVAGLSGLEKKEKKMSQYGGQIPDLTQWQDYGLGGAEPTQYPERVPDDWRDYGLPFFGQFTEQLGIISGEGLCLAAEVSPEIYGGRLLARTPMLELEPRDYKWMKVMRRPYPGMLALGDTGAVYEFDGSLGFFRRIWGGIKSVARKVRTGVRKVVEKIPGGKYLVRLGQKVAAVAKKFVRPLVAFVGKYAAKLAPVAALIPGYGPAIAAGLYTAGKVANLMQQYDVAITGKEGQARTLAVKGKDKVKKMKEFQKALKKEAEKEKKKQKKKGKAKTVKEKKKQRAKKEKIAKLKKQAKQWREFQKAKAERPQAVAPMPAAKAVAKKPMYARR